MRAQALKVALGLSDHLNYSAPSALLLITVSYKATQNYVMTGCCKWFGVSSELGRVSEYLQQPFMS